jgi:hypothetical protein
MQLMFMYVTQTSILSSVFVKNLINSNQHSATWMNIDNCKNYEASDMAKTPSHYLEHNLEIETGCVWTCDHDSIFFYLVILLERCRC